MSQHIVGVHYAVGSKIGEGSFGVIFEGENIVNKKSSSGGHPVAIKFEPRRSDAPQLRDEFRAYRILNGCFGIPQVYYLGQEGMHNVLIIDLLGPSLEDLFEWCGRKFSVKTTAMIARQMISRVRTIHDHDLIYRDIKPDNFLISEFQKCLKDGSIVKSVTNSANEDPNVIFMVDFGMAKQFRDPKTKQHIPYRERKSLSGTARYMSINTHFGKEQSRRDDLESIGHVLFYFLNGSLPWQGLKAPNNKLKYEKIGLTKQKIDPDNLLIGSTPKQFATYLKYVRSLKFDQDPDYDYLLALMDEVLENFENDNHYDWMDLNNGQGWDIRVNKRANLHGYGNPNPRNTTHNNASTTAFQQAENFNSSTVKGSNLTQFSSKMRSVTDPKQKLIQQHPTKFTMSDNTKSMHSSNLRHQSTSTNLHDLTNKNQGPNRNISDNIHNNILKSNQKSSYIDDINNRNNSRARLIEDKHYHYQSIDNRSNQQQGYVDRYSDDESSCWPEFCCGYC